MNVFASLLTISIMSLIALKCSVLLSCGHCVERRISSAIAYNTACVFHSGGCAPIPESDIEERSLEESAELFTNHKHLIAETPVPGERKQWHSGPLLTCWRAFCKTTCFLTSMSWCGWLGSFPISVDIQTYSSLFLLPRSHSPPRSFGIVEVKLTGWKEDALSEADPVWTLCSYPGAGVSSPLGVTSWR